MSEKTKIHYWAGVISGLVFSKSDVCPVVESIDRLKYMGYTTDMFWPKKMSTGRLLKKPPYEAMKKQRIRKFKGK